jgi:formate-dependent nitrite reductase membrane component NrfD
VSSFAKFVFFVGAINFSSIGPWRYTPVSMLPALFLISGLMRAVSAGVFLRRFREVRPVEPIRHRDLIFRVSHIRPIAGATFSLFTGLFLEQEKKQGGKTQ